MKNLFLSVFLIISLGCHQPQQRVYDRASVEVKDGQMVKLSNTNGIVLLDFTSFESNGVSCRWRFFDLINREETVGCGEVRESSKWLSYQSSSDSNLYIRSGGVWFPWSYASMTSVWIYYTSGKTEVDVLPNTSFNTEKLYDYNSPGNSVPGKPTESGVKSQEDNAGK